ncbi:DUF6515 family protein [Aquabacterium sp. J223]|uniref:DUF6515 family protein n=1 Tax=Aquabacterium sp. J223 TaxID=2898431 RepID=UPI0021ADB9D9|nr:DUF6515 family protein [Aquabacterium sp. J223]UUX94857.1 hypothetical protein LRS07_16515 [Aquabacterium sp. J223]
MHAVLPSRPAALCAAHLVAPLALAAALLAALPAAARDGVRSWHGGSRGGPAAVRPGPPPAFVHRPGWGAGPGWGAPAWRPPAHYHRPWPVYGHRPWPGYGWVVPVLPVAAATVWIGGSPYHRWGGGWYAPLPGGGYQAVPAPPGVVEAVPPGPPDPRVTPRFGQSPVQAEVDIQDCNRLAALDAAAQADAQEFQRQVAACLDGRGYTVAPATAAPQAAAPAATAPVPPAAPSPAP